MALVDGNTTATGYGQAPVPDRSVYWDQGLGTYRDPVSGKVALGSEATGWQWVTEAEYRTMSGLGMEDDFAPADMFTPSTPITDQFAHDMATYGNPAWEDGMIPNYPPGSTITPNGVIPPAIEQREAKTYPSVPAPYPGTVRGLAVQAPVGQMSKNIEDRRMPAAIPHRAPTPMPPPYTNPDGTPRLADVQVIGGQIVRLPR